MKRLSVLAVSLFIALFLLAPVAVAQDQHERPERVLISLQGDVTLPAGEQVDLLLVVGGTATIEGDATTVVAVDGRAILAGGSSGNVVSIASPVEVQAGAAVTGDIMTLDTAAVQIAPEATVGGTVRDLAPELVGIGAILAPALFLLFLGFVLVTLVAGLALAAIAARQVRAAEALITHEPINVLLAGLAGVFLPILLVLGLIVTVVGAPLGFAILLTVWPLTAYIGYLVAGIWIGDWLLTRLSPGVRRERPYAASVIGLLVLQVLSIVPPISAVASLFGLGAVILLAWRIFRVGSTADPTVTQGVRPVPLPG